MGLLDIYVTIKLPSDTAPQLKTGVFLIYKAPTRTTDSPIGYYSYTLVVHLR